MNNIPDVNDWLYRFNGQEPIDYRLAKAKRSPKSYGLRNYARMVLGDDRLDDFVGWAFGMERDENFYLNEVPNLWNKRHGHEYKVSKNDQLLETFDQMLKLYDANVERRSR